MNIEGTIAWFLNPASRVSAHYVIGRDGRVVQMVDEQDVAWHAGVSRLDGVTGVNAFSIGIELVGTADSGFTDRQMAVLYALIEDLVRRYQIPPERVVGHADVSPGRKIDPDGYLDADGRGQFNWQKTRKVAAAALHIHPSRDTRT